jgi:hypothetical protein
MNTDNTSRQATFAAEIRQGYGFEEDSLFLGVGMLDEAAVPEAHVRVPLKTLNRHGLIAGATGSGKTKTLQILAERLSEKGVPCLLMDIKGDMSGIAVPGAPHPKIDERSALIGEAWRAEAVPIEILTLSRDKGARLRATVTEFGPVLFSKMLGLNDTQGGIVAVVFKYCDDRKLPLVDLTDFKTVVNYLTREGKAEVEQNYGMLASSSVGTILRKVLELEQQGADKFFGEPSFQVLDLCRTDPRGWGIVSVLQVQDIPDKPKLFSTFMLALLAEVYASFPEVGDPEKPKLAIFIDEAHLVFQEAGKNLLEQIETVVKLIRSKGVGIFFCTQNPADIPNEVLGQLGLKIQHSLRAFTAKDRKAVKLAAENYPDSKWYDTASELTSLGIGEALVTALGPKGRPTPLARTLLCAPRSRMGTLTDDEQARLLAASQLAAKYGLSIDPESAHEILMRKMQAAGDGKRLGGEELNEALGKARQATVSHGSQKSMVGEILSSTIVRQVGSTVARELTRGLLGALGVKTRSRRR